MFSRTLGKEQFKQVLQMDESTGEYVITSIPIEESSLPNGYHQIEITDAEDGQIVFVETGSGETSQVTEVQVEYAKPDDGRLISNQSQEYETLTENTSAVASLSHAEGTQTLKTLEQTIAETLIQINPSQNLGQNSNS